MDRMLRYTEHRLKPEDRPRIRYEYIVTGRGEFPLDMLRYDRCWPMSSSDVGKVEMYHYENDIAKRREPRSIVMCSYSEPTVARWSSFGWSCGTSLQYA